MSGTGPSKKSKGKGKQQQREDSPRTPNPTVRDFSSVYRPTIDFLSPTPGVHFDTPPQAPIPSPNIFDEFPFTTPPSQPSSHGSQAPDIFPQSNPNLDDLSFGYRIFEDLGEEPEAEEEPAAADIPQPRRKRQLSRWQWADDEALIKAWLHVSTDATVGADQSGASFWSKVLAQCVMSDRGGSFQSKTTTAIKKHFADISAKLKLYAGCYAQVSGPNAMSGTNEADWERAAIQSYELQYGGWTMHQQWVLLKNQPAWHVYQADPKKVGYQTRKPSRSGSTSSGKRDRSQEEPVQGGFPSRPAGREATKRAAGRGASGSGSGAAGKSPFSREDAIETAKAAHVARGFEIKRARLENMIKQEQKNRMEHKIFLLDLVNREPSKIRLEMAGVEQTIIDSSVKDIQASHSKEQELNDELTQLLSLNAVNISSDSASV